MLSRFVQQFTVSQPTTPQTNPNVARTLKGILITLFWGSAAYLVVLLTVASQHRGQLPAILALMGLVIVLWLVVKRGQLRLASMLLIGGLWLILSLEIVRADGVNHPGYFTYPMILLIAALLLDSRAVIFVGGLSLLLTTGIYLAESSTLIPLDSMQVTSQDRWMIGTFYILIMTSLVYLTSLHIQRVSSTTRQLKEQTEILQTIFDHIPVMIAFFNEKGEFRLVNREWVRVLGWPLDEIHQQDDIIARLCPDPAEYQRAIYVMQSAPPGWHDFRSTTRDGNVIDTSWASVRLSSGMSVGIGRDITARKAAQQALRESEEKYRVLVENTSVGIWHIDANGYTVYVNPTMCRMLEINDPSRLEGETYHQFFTEESLTTMRHEHAKRYDGVASSYEVELVGARGTRRPILLSGAPIFSAEGELEGLMGTFADLTEHKQAEAQAREAERLKLALEHERQLSKLKDHFMTIVSHEFKTPLTVINLAAYRLADDHLNPDQRATKAHTIQEQVDLLTAMLNDLSLVVRAETGHLEFQPEIVHLGDFCQAHLQEMRQTIGANHRLVFANHIPDDTLDDTLYADPRLLDYIVRNLLTNAIKYSPEGSEIRCEIMRREDMLGIRISDQGQGIAPEDIPRVFEAYYRADEVKSRVEGTGLGLKIVKDCVKLHRGEITVQSEREAGSTFDVWLPRRPPPSLA